MYDYCVKCGLFASVAETGECEICVVAGLLGYPQRNDMQFAEMFTEMAS